MAMTLEQIEAEALALSEDSRVKLLERLLLSFEETAQTEDNVAQTWAEEAQRRDQEMDADAKSEIPAEDVFNRLRSSMK
jgi:putative addiction module component (TIGR02574 family)